MAFKFIYIYIYIYKIPYKDLSCNPKTKLAQARISKVILTLNKFGFFESSLFCRWGRREGGQFDSLPHLIFQARRTNPMST